MTIASQKRVFTAAMAVAVPAAGSTAFPTP